MKNSTVNGLVTPSRTMTKSQITIVVEDPPLPPPPSQTALPSDLFNTVGQAASPIKPIAQQPVQPSRLLRGTNQWGRAVIVFASTGQQVG